MYLEYLKKVEMLNIMRNGPRHNTIVETCELVTSYKMGWIGEYVWTKEIIVGSESGRQARVWVHSSSAA